MHELSIAQNILEIVNEHVPAGGKVKTVRITVGDLSGVVTESLEFCLSALASGTPLEGMAVEFERVPLVVRCGACGRDSRTDPVLGLCPVCGSAGTAVISGRELQVTEIEVDDGS